MEDLIHLGDNLDVLPRLPDGFFQLVYADPPFNTGRTQTRRTLEAVADENGDRTGFKGHRYTTRLLQESSYRDSFDDYLGFLEPRLLELRRVLHETGTLYLHLDYREAHMLMELVADSQRLVALDLVEVNPTLDVRNTTAEFAVELALSALGKRII